MQKLALLIIAMFPGLALAQAAPIPEPTTMALLASGAAAAGLYKFIKRDK
jgi:PEP-CTERM motif